jgi:cell division ATPase FtsA
MSKKSRIIGAVEIGTTTIKVVIGAFKRRKLSILGHAECPSRGVSKGSVSDYDAAFNATHSGAKIPSRRQ